MAGYVIQSQIFGQKLGFYCLQGSRIDCERVSSGQIEIQMHQFLMWEPWKVTNFASRPLRGSIEMLQWGFWWKNGDFGDFWKKLTEMVCRLLQCQDMVSGCCRPKFGPGPRNISAIESYGLYSGITEIYSKNLIFTEIGISLLYGLFARWIFAWR